MNRYLIPAIACMVMHYTPAHAGVFDQSAEMVVTAFASGEKPDMCGVDHGERFCMTKIAEGVEVFAREKDDHVVGVLASFSNGADTAVVKVIMNRMFTAAASTGGGSNMQTRVREMAAELSSKITDGSTGMISREGMTLTSVNKNGRYYLVLNSTAD